MPELEPPIREIKPHILFDTAYDTAAYRSALGNVPYIGSEIRLFNSGIVTGRYIPHITNMQIAGVLPSDQTCMINAVSYQASFDASKECSEHMFALLETGMRLKLLVGDKPMFDDYGRWEKNEDGPDLVRTYKLSKVDPEIHIPARQCFEVVAQISDELREELNNFTRNKTLRVFLHSMLTRDIQ